jgi:uncharacterized protein YjbI with pentapeptide repeats
MKDLHSILKAVSRGKMEIPKAEALIQELFEATLNSDVDASREPHQADRHSRKQTGKSTSSKRDKLDSSVANFGDRIGFSALLKKSRELGRKVEFRPAQEGFDCKLSIFTSVEVSPDTRVEGNIVSGSQWKSVAFGKTAEVCSNHFTLSQVNGLNCQRSNFSLNEFGLTRLVGVTIHESRFENNRLSRSQMSDVSVSEADFTQNKLLRTEFNGLVLNASRLANSVFSSTRWNECEIDQSDIQGLRFEDCSFSECRFINCEIVSAEPALLSGLHISNRTFEGLRSPEELLAALEIKPKHDQNTGRRHSGQPAERSGGHKRRPARH